MSEPAKTEVPKAEESTAADLTKYKVRPRAAA